MKIQAMMVAVLACMALGFWSVPTGAQSPTPCSGPACVGYDWGNGGSGGTGGALSSTSYMASHRMQRHSVITSDGAIHIIVNTGTPSSYNGSAQTGTLQLYSSSDHGTTWVNTYTFPGTETSQQPGNYTVSTDDVALRTDRAGNQFLDVAYDQETAGGAAANALMFTELLYRSNASRTNTWRLAPNSSYPQMVNNPSYSATTLYQEPSFAQDQDGNLWLADLELNTSITQGGIALYERKGSSTTWGSVSVSIPNNTMPPNPGPSPSQIAAENLDAFAHAPRLVFVLPNINNLLFGTIGLLFQGAEANSTTVDCLYWTTITGNPSSGGTLNPMTPLELSHYSNSPASNNCNLPMDQGSFPDTAVSVATDLITADQYLGFVINDGSGGSTNEAVFAMSYNGTTNTWNTSHTATFNNNNNNNTVYVKSVYATDSSGNTYSYMIVNQGGGSLERYSSPTISSAQPNPSYSTIDNLTYGSTGTFNNPRIEAPEYVNTNSYTNLPYVPIWLQYVISGTTQSLLYWNQIPN